MPSNCEIPNIMNDCFCMIQQLLASIELIIFDIQFEIMLITKFGNVIFDFRKSRSKPISLEVYQTENTKVLFKLDVEKRYQNKKMEIKPLN